MPTLATRTKELSGLPFGTLAQHLAAITLGSGSGKTIFASQMAVCIEAQEISVQNRAEKQLISCDKRHTQVVTGEISSCHTALSIPDRNHSTVFVYEDRSTAHTIDEKSYIMRIPASVTILLTKKNNRSVIAST